MARASETDLPALSRRSVLRLGGGVALLVATGGCAAGSGSGDGSGDPASATLRIAVPSYPSSWDQDFVGFDPTALMLFKNVFPYMIDYGVTTVGGTGRFRGGAGLRRDLRLVTGGELLTVVKKTRTRPWALAGGREPEPTQVVLFPGTPQERRVSTARTRVTPGDRVTLLTAGGGGHGDPTARDPAAVSRDVADGYVSAQVARDTYGVVP